MSMAVENYVDEAERVIQNLIEKDRRGNSVINLKTNQIRKFLTAINIVANKIAIYKAKNPGKKEMKDELAMEVHYLQVKLVYQVGREKKDIRPQYQPGPVEKFVSNAGLVERIKKIGNSIAAFEQYHRYVEALVAYHKFYGGKDK